MEKFRSDGTLFKMPWSIQLATLKDIINLDKLESHRKSKDRILTVVNRI